MNTATMTRDDYKAALDGLNVEYRKQAKTATLRRLYEEACGAAALDAERDDSAQQIADAVAARPADPQPVASTADAIDAAPAVAVNLDTSPGTALEVHATVIPGENLWNQYQVMAAQLSRSNLVPKALVGRADDILVICMISHDLRMSITWGLSNVNVIEGKPALSSQGMVTLIRANGHKLSGEVERDEQQRPVACVVRGERGDTGETMIVDYTITDAIAAGLCVRDDKKPNGVSAGGKPWEKHTGSMLWARAVSTLAKRLFSDALAGIGHTPEELAPEYVWAEDAAHVQQTGAAPRPSMTDEQREILNARMGALTDEQKSFVARLMREANERGELPPRAQLGSTDFVAVLSIIETALTPVVEDDDDVADAELVDEVTDDTALSLATDSTEAADHGFPEVDMPPVRPVSIDEAVAQLAAAGIAATEVTTCDKCGDTTGDCECPF